MTTKTRDKRDVYGEVNSEADLKHSFNLVRQDVARSTARDELNELYRRAGYLVALARSLAWREKFGADEADRIWHIADTEFTRTFREINARAREIEMHSDIRRVVG